MPLLVLQGTGCARRVQLCESVSPDLSRAWRLGSGSTCGMSQWVIKCNKGSHLFLRII